MTLTESLETIEKGLYDMISKVNDLKNQVQAVTTLEDRKDEQSDSKQKSKSKPKHRR